MSMARRSLLSGLLLAAMTFAHSQVATAQSFPRLGAYLIGSPQNYNQKEAEIAKLGVVVLGMYQGWTGGGQTPQQVIAAIKKLNPNIKVFIYTNIGVLQYPIPVAMGYEGLTPIDTTPWWLHVSGTSGAMVVSEYGGHYYSINTTTYAKPNSSGVRYPQWRATLDNSLFVTPNPSVDGIYVDNVYWKPRVNGDWTLSGTSQSRTSATTQQIYRLGYAAHINDLKALMGADKYVIGNVADWGEGGADISGYQGVLAGGLMESIIGQSSSYESWEGWAGMMAYYTKIMNATAAPQLSIFSQDGSATDYQGMRYGLCSALLGNAYYYYDLGVNTQTYNTVTTFDEFNSNLGASLAAPLVFPGAAAWQKGVYRRDFENGIALVNPKGNGARTVTLETSYKHLKGTQDPAVNNGETVTQVTLNDRDGVILLRLTPKAAAATPQAPASLTVH
jgi:hypothetical protein